MSDEHQIKVVKRVERAQQPVVPGQIRDTIGREEDLRALIADTRRDLQRLLNRFNRLVEQGSLKT